jgi:drug/metabolite transporter (DMT)-like permease
MSRGEWFPDEDQRKRRGELPLLDALLEANVADYQATTQTGAHRKTQSLREIPTGGAKSKGRHHRHKSSISELFMSVSSGLESIAADVKVEARMVRESFKEGLEEAQNGRTFFLDMNLTRSLSVLPEELPMMIEETTGVHVEMEGDISPPIATSGPYMALLGAVLAVSSNGSALSILTGVAPPLKLYWRMVATALALSFFAIRTMARSGGLPKLSFSQWLTFVAAAVAYTGHGLLYIYALQYTSIGNVVIGANSQAILLILGKFIMGQEVVAMEGGGVFLAFCGCMLCATDEGKNPDKANSGSDALLGDLLALASGAFGVAYLTFAKAVRHHLPVTVFMFFVMALGSCMVLVFIAIIQEGALSFSRDPFVGLLGWMTFDLNRIYVLVHIAIICNIIGAMVSCRYRYARPTFTDFECTHTFLLCFAGFCPRHAIL